MAQRRNWQQISGQSESQQQQQQQQEENTATAACEQCRSRKVKCDRALPQCSNCEKNGVMCEFPNRGKRINHVKQLVEDVSGLAARLDSIDGTINNLMQYMSQIHTNSSKESSQASTFSSSDFIYQDSEDVDAIFSFASSNGQTSKESSVDSLQDGQELGQNSTSWLPIGERSLFGASRKALGNLLERMDAYSSNPDSEYNENDSFALNKLTSAGDHIKSTLIQKYENFPFLNFQESAISPISDQPVAAPPRVVLDGCLQSYLKTFNVLTPIFDESSLKEMIERCYSQDATKCDEAYSLCLNNIIVLTSGMRSRVAQLNKDYPKGMDDELLPAFLNNSFRAFRHLDRFFQPHIINLQALATLAIVAREHAPSRFFDMICQLATHVIKFIDLRQNSNSTTTGLSTDEGEGQSIYWALFAMDKQRTYLGGRPFHLHFYDSDVELLQAFSSDDLIHKYRIAHVHMMAVWEEIYISLYSNRALRKGFSYRQQQITRLDALSKKWCFRNRHLLSNTICAGRSEAEASLTELKYSCHVAQVLIHRSSAEGASKQVEIANSRAALQIIIGVYKSAATEFSVALLSRMIRYYPLISLHSLFFKFLEQPSRESMSDVELMLDVRDAVASICNPNIKCSCITRIIAGVEWYCEILEAIRRAIESSPPTPPNYSRPQSANKRTQDTLNAIQQFPTQITEPPSKKYRRPGDHDKGQLESISNPVSQAETSSSSSASSPQPWWLSAGGNRARQFSTHSAKSLPKTSGLADSVTIPIETSEVEKPIDMELSSFLNDTMPMDPLFVPINAMSKRPFSPDQPVMTVESSNTGLSSYLGFGDYTQDLIDPQFDPFLGRPDFLNTWDPELQDQPMADIFFLQP